MSNSDMERKIAVIFVTDVVGFSKRMETNEEETLKSFRSCKDILENLFSKHGGRIFNIAGDSILAEFQSAVSAVICAAQFQKLIKEKNESLDESSQMFFRLGINMGDVIVDGENLYGDGVNVAARLEALSQSGGICLSKSVYDFVSQKVDLIFEDIGKHRVKETNLHAYDVVVEGAERRKVTNSAKTITDSQEDQLSSIAVLPFQNLSNDTEQEYFVDGITEDIINNLSMWRTFPVTSSNSSFTYKNTSVNVKVVGKELGVRYLVKGSVRKGGEKVRITAQLIECEADHQLWSEKWDRNLDDIFDVQDEVSTAIAAQVNPTLENYESERVERVRPNNLNAWDLYLKSMHTFKEREATEQTDKQLEKARILCEQAIKMDNSMSHAYSLLSEICNDELNLFTTKDSAKTLNEIFEFGKRAYDLDQKNPIAACCIATHYFFSGQFEKSKQYSSRAIKLNPSYPEALYRFGQGLVHSGEFGKSIEHYHKAFELNPLDPKSIKYKNGLFFANLGLGNYDLALDSIEECILQFPQAGGYKGFRAATLGHLNRKPEAKIALDEYLNLRPNLKKKEDFKKIFVPNSSLADILISGLIKAGWQPDR